MLVGAARINQHTYQTKFRWGEAFIRARVRGSLWTCTRALFIADFRACTIEILQKAVKKGKYNFEAKKKVPVCIRVSIAGLATINLKAGTLITKNPIHRILGWYPDIKEPDIFGVVVKGEVSLFNYRAI